MKSGGSTRSEFEELDELGIRDRGGKSKGLAATDWWSDLTKLANSSCADPEWVASIPAAISNAMNTTKGCGYYYQTTSMYPGEGPCSAVYFETEEYMQRCYPIIPKEYYGLIVNTGAAAGAAVANKTIASVVDNVGTLADGGWNTYVTDAQRGFVVIMVAGLAVSLFFCLLYMVILRFFAGLMAWTTVFLINGMAVGVTILCAHKSGLLGSKAAGALGAQLSDELVTSSGGSLTGDEQKVMKIVTYVMAAITLLIVLFTLIMIKRIKIAVACLKVAASAVSAMPSLLLFPLVTFVSFIVLFVYWVIVFTYLWSSGDLVETHRENAAPKSYSISSLYDTAAANSSLPTSSSMASHFASPPPPPYHPNVTIPCYDDPDCYYSVQFNKKLQYLFAYHIFGLLWTNQFIIGFGYVVIAGAVAQYYWHRGIRADMPSRPVLLAIKNASVYHMGSIAFGAFIVAVIQFVRLLLEYIDRKSKKLQQGNPAAKWVMCCLRYCLWYLEKVMKFINRNAYIMVAVKGSSYCASAVRAVKLIVCNALALAAVNVIGDMLIFMGKMSVVIGSALVAFLLTDIKRYTDPASDTYLSSPVVPVALSAVAAYVVANIFFSVYEMAVDTILLSFCEDRESNNGTPQCAPKLLMSAIGKASAFKQQQQQQKSQAVANAHGAGPKAPSG